MSAPTERAAEILERAADRVQFIGWTQGGFARTDYGSEVYADDPKAKTWCAVGALRREGMGTVGLSSWMLDDEFAALQALEARVGEIAVWNDYPQQTADKVADEMRRAAKDLRNAPHPTAEGGDSE